jgi:hypothetical protein
MSKQRWTRDYVFDILRDSEFIAFSACTPAPPSASAAAKAKAADAMPGIELPAIF